MPCNFSYQHYQEILILLKKKGYRFCLFSEPPKKRKMEIYLRHDVDLSLEKALCLAEIENREKVRSTFLIRLTAPFYNVLEAGNIQLIRKIIGWGDVLGLHFAEDDCGSKKLTLSSIEREVVRQRQILYEYFKVKKVVSFHRPSSLVLNCRFKNFINTYSADFFSRIKYLSDSKGAWREGCVCRWLRSEPPPLGLQVLTHPIWWGRRGKDTDKSLCQYLRSRADYLNDSLVKDQPFYKKRSLEIFYKD